MSQADVKIALLIDADNSPATKIDVILSELAKYGVVYIRRAYGNWKSPTLKSWEDVLHEYAIQPIQQFDYSKGKNATDIALVIDAMDLLYTQKLDGFGIVSSDSDFTLLIMRIHTQGLKVFGFGEKKTPPPFVNACSKFTYLEAMGVSIEDIEPKPSQSVPIKIAPTVATTPPTNSQPSIKPPLNIKSDTKLLNLLRSAVDATVGEKGWSSMSSVGSHISNQTSFDCQNYGFKKLSDLFIACDLFEMGKDKKGTMIVRRKQKKQQLPPPPPANDVELVHTLKEGKIRGNAVELVSPPIGGRLGGGQSNSIEASNLTHPHPIPPPLREGALELNLTVLPHPAILPKLDTKPENSSFNQIVENKLLEEI